MNGHPEQNQKDSFDQLFWGSHLCYFYESPTDLTDVLCHFIHMGIERGEQCLWLASFPVPAAQALHYIVERISDRAQNALAAKQIIVLPEEEWRFGQGDESAEGRLAFWQQKVYEAQQRGFSGVRACVTQSAVDEASHNKEIHLERRFHRELQNLRLIALCAYPQGLSPHRVMDVIHSHTYLVEGSGSSWQLVSPLMPVGVEDAMVQVWNQWPEALAILKDGKVVYGNQAFHQLVGDPPLFSLADCRDLKKTTQINDQNAADCRYSGLGAKDHTFSSQKIYSFKKDEMPFWVEAVFRPAVFHGSSASFVSLKNITEVVQAEKETYASLHLLNLIHSTSNILDLAQGIIDYFGELTECKTVGIRLAQGGVFPFLKVKTTPQSRYPSFCRQEDPDAPQSRVRCGQTDGMASICACALVLSQRVDHDYQRFTRFGSFWSPNVSTTIDQLPEEKKRLVKNTCWFKQGYGSLAFIPLKVDEQVIGLLLLGDPQEDRFDPMFIGLLERLADRVAATLALRKTIEALKTSKTALKESEGQHRMIFNVLQEGIWVIDAAANTVMVNPKMAELLGYTQEEMVGKHLFDFMDQQEIETCKENIKRREQGIIEQHEFKFLRKDKRPIFTLLHTSPISDEAGNYQGAIAAVSDITERKAMEERLIKSNEQLRLLSKRIESATEEERTRLAREIHDEFGEILSSVKMDLRWLERVLPEGQSPVKERIQAISNLMNKLHLSVQRIVHELRPYGLNQRNLAEIIKWQLLDFEKRTGIKSFLFCEIKELKLDPEKNAAIYRVVQEALTNILKHAEAKRVEIHLSLENDSIWIKIEDNGKGFALERILDPKSLGLLGMRERVFTLGGDLDIQSMIEKGTLITLRVSL